MSTSTMPSTASNHAALLAGPDPEADDEIPTEVPRYGPHKLPLIVPPNGGIAVPYSRPSNYGGVLEYEGNLTDWKMGRVALGMRHRADLVLRAQNVLDADSREGKAELKAIAMEAFTAGGGSDRAALGTAWHTRFERYNRGEELPPLSEPFASDFASYVQAVADYGLICHRVGQFVVNDQFDAAGTYDEVWELPGFDELLIGDDKTGKDLDRPARKYTVQCAIYAGGCAYAPPSLGPDRKRSFTPQEAQALRTPVLVDGRPVSRDWGLILHTPAGEGRTEVHLVDLNAGRTGAAMAMSAKEWGRRKDVIRRLTPGEVPGVDPVQAWRDSLLYATEPLELTRLWEKDGHLWPDDVKQLASARMVELKAELQARTATRLVTDQLGGTVIDEVADEAVAEVMPVEAADPVLTAISTAGSRAALAELWNRDGGSWTEKHKAAADARYRDLAA